jgi:flavin-dependent dehydrogenase
VRTEDGEEIPADIVIDASGRRSALPAWLEGINAKPLAEEKEDCGFIYYGRHFQSGDGSTPPLLAGLLTPAGTVSMLTLPADNGTWGIGIITSAKDAELRGLKNADRWEAAVKSFPLQAHWLDGEPIDDDIAVMAKIEDRHRTTVVNGEPVVTGVLPVADSWACTNPSLGRGISIGLMHAVALRDHLRESDLDDRTGVASRWAQMTDATVEPWYRATLDFDRHRLAEIESLIDGQPYEPNDPGWEMTQALGAASGQDPDLFRAFLSIVGVLDLPGVALADQKLAEKAVTLGAGWRDQPILGPSRDDLVKIAAG